MSVSCILGTWAMLSPQIESADWGRDDHSGKTIKEVTSRVTVKR